MGELDSDFADMIKARDEQRRRIEEEFRKIYAKIKENKDIVIREGQKINEDLKKY